MRVVVRNMRNATEKSSAWKILLDEMPDIVLLQEVRGIPKDIENTFDSVFHISTGGKNHEPIKSGTAILVK